MTYLLKYVEYLMVIFMLKKASFCQLQKKEQILNLDRVNGWTGGSPSQRVRADGRITISESTGTRADHQLRYFGRKGRSPSQRVLADRRIAISESTGGLADHHLREYRLTGRSPAERFRAYWRITISEITG